jgi:hypothetical protein
LFIFGTFWSVFEKISGHTVRQLPRKLQLNFFVVGWLTTTCATMRSTPGLPDGIFSNQKSQFW